MHFHVYRKLQGYRDMGFMEGHYFEANNFTLFITFMLDVTMTQLQMHIDYDPAQIGERQIRSICDYYVHTLEAIAADPHARFETFSPLSAQEHKQLSGWNETELEYDRGQTIPSLFEAQALRTPNAIAVVHGETRLTYRELNERANQLAHYLRELGAGPEKLVAVCVERSAEMPVVLLGILKSGAAYVPLDPAYPQDRLEAMLEQSRSPLVISQRSLAARLPNHAARRVWMDDDSVTIQTRSKENPSCGAAPEQLAYVLFTSGSTGVPKGVALEHRNAVSFVAWSKTVYADEDLQGVLAGTSLNFDLSIFELFVTLCRGGKVIVAQHVLELPRLAAANEVTLGARPCSKNTM